MSVFSRINETTIKIIIIVLLFGLGMYTSFVYGQSIKQTSYGSPAYNPPVETQARNTVRPAADINTGGRAVALQNAINSPYDDIKPKLARCGNRLYFSRNFHPGKVNGVDDPEDIWYGDFDENSGMWSEPIHTTGILNNAGPNYINNISAIGDTIILGNQY